MDLLTLFIILLLAFVCEAIDSGVGMGYGTILSPVLLLLGYAPSSSVPAVLLSQAVGGMLASYMHHRLKNAEFSGNSRERALALLISFLGIAATVFAAWGSLQVSKNAVQLYIAILVSLVGLFLLCGIRFSFGWWKAVLLALVSAFNKGLSGGGFGPIVTGGQVIVGQDQKTAIASTTLAEAPICIAGFITYLVLKGTGGLDWPMTAALCIGSLIGAPLGPRLTRALPRKSISPLLGLLCTALGLSALWRFL